LEGSTPSPSAVGTVCPDRTRLGRQSGRPSKLRTWNAVGSSPTWATDVRVELPGVLATFSRWRSRVQIPPRILQRHPRSVPEARDSPKIEDRVRFLAGILPTIPVQLERSSACLKRRRNWFDSSRRNWQP